ncbi:hypothetical protein H0H81_004230 [Sphagnurus paluster]|uniref:Uncharacterized protein n=1 Tax=Sphagnurus paluster TaxID=117069 RepID=A0A9P7FUY5_9AGAR|nr:hypothetical protein H0H81_004230 [Sphagnurus paluster]
MAQAAPHLLDIPLDTIVLTLSPNLIIPWVGLIWPNLKINPEWSYFNLQVRFREAWSRSLWQILSKAMSR